MGTSPVASNGKERENESVQKQKTKRRRNTLIFNTILSLTRKRAALNTYGGPTTYVQVKEAVSRKVSEMCG